MGTLADLVGGFQGGYDFTTEQRMKGRKREYMDRMNDQLSRERASYIDDFETAGGDLAEYGIKKDMDFNPPTLGEKLFEKAKSWFQQGQQEEIAQQQAVQDEAKAPAPAAGFRMQDGGPVRLAIDAYSRKRTHSPDPNASYAEGGRVRREPETEEGKRARSRKEARTGRTQAIGSEPATGNPREYPPARKGQTGNSRYTRRQKVNRAMGSSNYGPIAETSSKVRKAGRFAGKAALPVATAVSAAGSYGTGTDEYRERGIDFEMLKYDDDDSNFEMFLKDLGVRSLGVMQDLGNTLTFGMFEDDEMPAPSFAPEVQPDVGEAATEAVNEPPPAKDVAAAASTEDPPGQAIQKGPPKPEMVDWSKVTIPPEEIPRHSTDEWAQERKRHMRNAMLRGDDPWAVGEAITKDQILNFTGYMYQAQMLLAGNDPMAAARAATAAYNYFPNGSDIKFGIMQGKDGQRHLIGMGRDEKTGDPIGNPMALTPESIGTMIEQAQNPDAWRTWTKDWRDEELARMEFELDRDYKEGMLGVAQENARSNALSAEASMTRALNPNSSGEGGLSLSERRSSMKELRNILTYESGENFDPATVDQLMDFGERLFMATNGQVGIEAIGAGMKEILAQNPEASEREIGEYILRKAGLVE